MPDNEMKPYPEIGDEMSNQFTLAIDEWIALDPPGCAGQCKDDGTSCFQYEVFRDDPRYCRKFAEHVLRRVAPVILSAWNARVPAQSAGGGEPVAWSYELAASHGPDGFWNWNSYLEREPPKVSPAGSVRNLQPLYARAVLTDTAREGEYERGWKAAVEACIERVQNARAREGSTGPYGAISLMRNDLEVAIRALPIVPSNVGTGEGA